MKFSILTTTILLMFFSNVSQAKNTETAILAGGCFWGMEELLRRENGVIATEVGYTGGNVPNPSYEVVTTGLTGHAEAVKITFDSTKISYEKLLKFFFMIHDPTTLNRQENDIGTQYRSAIFYLNDEQKKIAQDVIRKADESGVYGAKVVTKLEKVGEFYEAEGYHQDYLQKNPYGYTCHHVHKEWSF